MRDRVTGPVLLVATGAALDSEVPGDVVRLDPGVSGGRLPEARFGAVILRSVLDRIPPADIGWLLDAAFARAEAAVLVEVRAAAEAGLGSPDWWQRRVEEVARHHPGVSWRLDTGLPLATGTEAHQGFETLAVPPPESRGSGCWRRASRGSMPVRNVWPGPWAARSR